MASYGIPYQGSKSQLADWVIDQLPCAETFVDLFAGGCAITHCALLSGKWEKFICNDLDGRGMRLFRDCAMGKADLHRPCTKAIFKRERDRDYIIRCTGSFGNVSDAHSYVYGEHLRHKELAELVMFAPTIREKLCAYKALLKELHKEKDKEWPHLFYSLDRVQRLVRLESLEGLKGLERVKWSSSEYSAIKIPKGATVYCDPPYKSTEGYHNKSFDHQAFYDWCIAQPFPVFVSEYQMPDAFVCVSQRDRMSTLSPFDKSTIVTEKLFVQKSMAEEVRILQGRLF